MIIAGFWGVAPCNLLTFTEVFREKHCFHLRCRRRRPYMYIPYRRSNFYKITREHAVEDVFLHSFSHGFTVRILV